MPTVMRLGGLRIMIWSNDHRPAHVHVNAPDAEAVFHLNCPAGPPSLPESYGFRLADLNRMAAALSGSLTALCAQWRTIYGDY